MITRQQAALELMKRRRARTSLAEYAMAIDIPGRPASDDDDEWVFRPVETSVAPHHKLILDSCQGLADGSILAPDGSVVRGVMIFMPPGSAKSTYASVVFPAWYLSNHPGRQIIMASYGSDIARKQGRRTRQIIESRRHQHICGTAIRSDVRAADQWHLDNGSEYMACGLTAGITGNRADGAIIDDPIKGRAEADSPTVRSSTLQAYQDDLKTRLKPGGWSLLIQTRWYEDDLAGSILPEHWEGESGIIKCRDGQWWQVLCIQAECERLDDPLGREIGDILWPQWFTTDHFAKFKTSPRTWRSLFQQTPTAQDGLLFNDAMVRRYRDLPKNLNLYMTGDFAVTPDGGDYTELAVWGVDHLMRVYVVDWWYRQADMLTWVAQFGEMISRYRPSRFIAEQGVIRRAAEPLMRNVMRDKGFFVTLEWVSCGSKTDVTAKEANAGPFISLCDSGIVHWPQTTWADRVIDQLKRFPAGRYDDAVDTCSHFGRYIHKAWAGAKPRDPPQTLQEAFIDTAIKAPTVDEMLRKVRARRYR